MYWETSPLNIKLTSGPDLIVSVFFFLPTFIFFSLNPNGQLYIKLKKINDYRYTYIFCFIYIAYLFFFLILIYTITFLSDSFDGYLIGEKRCVLYELSL